MENVIFAIVVLGALGALFGGLLAFASKIFYVEQDERIEKIVAVLPGANCGGCGYAGCSNCASEIVAGNAKINACPVGGAACAAKIGEIMGIEAESGARMVAHVNCCGGDKAEKKFNYEGISDCLAASKVAGGPLSCSFGCFGLGSCVKVCKFDAIHIVDGKAVVDVEKCVNCGACKAACPRKLIETAPANQKVFVSCASKAKGQDVRKQCSIGCIGCTLCTRKCPTGAITVENNLASIDYSKCINCGACAEACPRKLIVNLGAKPEVAEEVAAQ